MELTSKTQDKIKVFGGKIGARTINKKFIKTVKLKTGIFNNVLCINLLIVNKYQDIREEVAAQMAVERVTNLTQSHDKIILILIKEAVIIKIISLKLSQRNGCSTTETPLSEITILENIMMKAKAKINTLRKAEILFHIKGRENAPDIMIINNFRAISE